MLAGGALASPAAPRVRSAPPYGSPLRIIAALSFRRPPPVAAPHGGSGRGDDRDRHASQRRVADGRTRRMCLEPVPRRVKRQNGQLGAENAAAWSEKSLSLPVR